MNQMEKKGFRNDQSDAELDEILKNRS